MPHVTEKSAARAEHPTHPAYTFVVAADATKGDVIAAMKNLYKVTPKKVAMVTIPSKQVFARGKVGTKSGYKKATVYLKAGEKITLA